MHVNASFLGTAPCSTQCLLLSVPRSLMGACLHRLLLSCMFGMLESGSCQPGTVILLCCEQYACVLSVICCSWQRYGVLPECVIYLHGEYHCH